MSSAIIFRDEHTCPVHVHTSTFYVYTSLNLYSTYTHMSTAFTFRGKHTCPVHTHSSTFYLHKRRHLHSNFVYIQTHMSNAPVD